MEQHKVFSLSEVSQHSAKKDCWLIIHGKVYNVTPFLEDHPGGDDVLIEASANGDATRAFEDVGHSSTATSMMVSYLIGIMEGQDSVKDGPHQIEEANDKTDKTWQVKKPTSTANNFFNLLMPLIVIGIALGAWYYFNKGKVSFTS